MKLFKREREIDLKKTGNNIDFIWHEIGKAEI